MKADVTVRYMIQRVDRQWFAEEVERAEPLGELGHEPLGDVRLEDVPEPDILNSSVP